MSDDKVIITATFDSGRIEEALAACMALRGRKAAVRSSPSTVDPQSLVPGAAGTASVVLVRVEDWDEQVESRARDFATAVRAAPTASTTTTPRVVCVVPASRRARADAAFARRCESAETFLATELGGIDGVRVVRSAHIDEDAPLFAATLGALLAHAVGFSEDVLDAAHVLATIIARNKKQRDRLLFDVEYVAPSTDVEKRVAAIWEDVLEVDRVGLEDDVFELGCDSLLATRGAVRINEAFGVTLAVGSIFEARTTAKLVEQLALPTTDAPRLERVSREAPVRASFAQERLWFLAQLEPDGATYNVPFAVRIRPAAGRLDVAALERSLGQLVRRHEVLRTTLREVGGELRQIVHESSDVTLERIEAVGDTPAARETSAREQVQKAAQRPFDLANGPLLRAALVHVDRDEHVLVVAMHHVAADGWSLGIVQRELAVLYEACTTGRAAALEELAIQYADFAAWQRTWLEGGVLDAQLAYWSSALRGAPTTLELPTDRPRPLLKRYRGAKVAFEVPSSTAARAHEVARAQGATVFMLLLAAYGALLGRWSRQQDIVIGTPIASRVRSEIEPLVGMFVNTLALRMDLSGSPSFTELVARAKVTSLGGFAHQDVPFERLVEVLAPPRDTSRTPVFQAMFTLQNAPAVELRLGDLEVRGEPLGLDSSKVDVALEMLERDGRLIGTFEYDEALFDRTTIERMAEHFNSLLRAAVDEPTAPVARLPLMTEAEKRRVLVEWNATAHEVGEVRTVHGMIEAQAKRTPDAVAVEHLDRRLTYRELDERANRVAHWLLSRGVTIEERVAVEVERSEDMLSAVLGVMKAGGAYVPVDPKLPEDRKRFMREDAGARLVLDGTTLVEALASDAETSRPAIDVRPEHLAYVLYTSGSTGRPKGVMVEHGSVANLLVSLAYEPGTSPDETTLSLTTLSFDVSVAELFLPLAFGAKVVVGSREAARDPKLIAAIIETTGARTFGATPTTWRMMVDTGWRPSAGMEIHVAGEALPRDLADALVERGAKLWNLYGPTEATVYASGVEVEPGRITIGRPLRNTQLYVVDDLMQPVPIGVPGELCVAGAGVARGYLGRPELTADKFVSDPFAGRPGARMYRTGDLARWLPSGEVDYLGRLDHQVKIRGFRIELGEIESVLSAVAGVRESVVLAREDSPGDKLLVAYVVASEGLTLEVDTLRRELGRELPDYMVPSAFVVLDALPMTTTGKVDRNALPEPDFAAATVAYVAPRTPTEQTLTEAFATLLRIERVGVHDDFFALGGHSLLATRLASRVHEQLAVSVPVRIIFEAPTVAGLAEHVERRRAGATGPRLERVADRRRAPLSYNQLLWWRRQARRPDSPGHNNVHAARLRGSLDVAAFSRSVDEEVRRHDALRTTFELVDGEPMQLVGEPRRGVLEHLDMPGASSEAVDAVVREESVRRPELARSTCRLRLLRIADDEHVLVIAAHRIAVDPAQCDELIADILAIYEAFSAGKPSPLSDPPLSYVDYAAWQRKVTSTPETRERVASARRRLEGAVPVALPFDRSGPEVITTEVHRAATVITEPLWVAMEELGHAESTTQFVVLSAIFKAFLSALTQQSDVTVIAPNGLMRGLDPSLASVFGCYGDYFIIRTDLSGDPTLREIVRREQPLVLEVQRNVDVPSVLVTDDCVEGPLWRVVLNSIAMPHGKPVEPSFGLTVEGIPVPRHRMVDLAWAVFGRDAALYGSWDKFDASTVESLAGQLSGLLARALAAPDEPIARLWQA